MNAHLKAFLIVVAVWLAAVALLYGIASATGNEMILMLVAGLLMFALPMLGVIGLLLLVGYHLQRRRERNSAESDPSASAPAGDSADRPV